MTVTRSQFRDQHKDGIKTSDQPTLDRLKNAGVDGKKLLEGADLNKDGSVAGQRELDTLFNKVDDGDRDGSRHTIGDAKPTAVLAALKGEPAMPTGPAAPTAVDDLYKPDPPPAPLQLGAKGPEVKAAQEKLLKAGYPLPRFGADSDFGKETDAAVRRFQGDSKLPQTGVIDGATAQALDGAKPGGARPVDGKPPVDGVRYPEYDQMFKDGVLSSTVAVGFDEDGWDVSTRREVLQGLHDRGFERLDVTNLTDGELKERGFDPATIDRQATYFTKDFEHEGKPVHALLRVVDRDTPDAKGQFAKGMKGDDLVLYGGHGRRGSGPDFDHADSDAGNYVMGKPYEDGHYKLGDNDLKKPGALGNQYQMMMFSACTTTEYFDDLREVKGKTSANLDVLGTSRITYWNNYASSILSTLDGVMGGKSVQDLEASLEDIHAKDGGGDAFKTQGFGDNRYRPSRR